MLRFGKGSWLRAVTAPRVAQDPKSTPRRLTNMLADLRNDVTCDETAVRGGRDAQSACALARRSLHVPGSSQNPRYGASQVHLASDSLTLLCDPLEELMFFIRPTRSCGWQAVWSGVFRRASQTHQTKGFAFSDCFIYSIQISEDLIFAGLVVSPWSNSWSNVGPTHVKKQKNPSAPQSFSAYSVKCFTNLLSVFHTKSCAV